MYKKIAIIGNAGSGKSTLSIALHTMLGLPLYHLDQYFWKPGWVEPDQEEFKQVHHKLCDQPTWIIEGIATKLFELRAQQADVIIFLDIPKYICLYRVLKRVICDFGTVRKTSAKGCPERGPDWKFLKFIWNFNTERKPKIVNILHRYKDQKEVFVVKNNKELAKLCKKFSNRTLN